MFVVSQVIFRAFGCAVLMLGVCILQRIWAPKVLYVEGLLTLFGRFVLYCSVTLGKEWLSVSL